MAPAPAGVASYSLKRAGAVALVAAALGLALSDTLLPPTLDADLTGRVALITGGSRGSGRGFAQGLSEAGATVYITGRSRASLDAACASTPGPGRCIAKVVDSGDDASLEALFADVARETGGVLDILVNNAYSGLGYWGKHQLLGKPFWEQGMGLYDAVTNVGVRSHYKATLLGLPLLRKSRTRGLIVNSNSAACLMYALNVPYGMGKCAIDKMTAGMAMELTTEGIDAVTWWAKEPMQTEEVRAGNIDGTTAYRGAAPGLEWFRFDKLFHTALAGTLLFEGRALSAVARDPARHKYSGLALQTGQVAQKYGVVDERGIRSPSFLSVKFNLFAWIPQLAPFTEIPPASSARAGGTAPRVATATAAQRFVFGALPDVYVPQWTLKLLYGTPPTMQWPLAGTV